MQGLSVILAMVVRGRLALPTTYQENLCEGWVGHVVER